MQDLAVRCQCGSLAGTITGVSPRRVNRVVCHCQGCTSYAQALGRAERIFDEHGGTDVIHVSPRAVVFDTGIEHIACARMTERGALRWYARCCRTPLAHTLPSPGVPFLAINHACIVWPGAASRDDIVGPVRARLNGRFARGQMRRLRADRRALISMLAHYLPLFGWWLVRGDARRSPFWDRSARRFVCEVRALEPADGARSTVRATPTPRPGVRGTSDRR